MHTLEGVCQVAGRFAYVAQEAWIFNASVKENILFGEEMDGELYSMVISACSLGPDLDVLRDGDETEVGMCWESKGRRLLQRWGSTWL